MKNTITSLICLAAVALATSAQAITISVSPNGALAGANYVDFNGVPLGSTDGTYQSVAIDFSGNSGAVVGALSGKYAAPFLSANNGTHFGNPAGADTTTYLSTGTSSITLTFDDVYSYLGLLWGSVDNYNHLTFYNGLDFVGTVSGSDVQNSPNGDQGVSGTIYVNFNVAGGFDRVVASSTSYAFEFDNVAYGPRNVPDAGSSLVLLGLGLFGLAFARRSIRR